MAAPFVLVLPDGAIGGYYTLSATAVKLGISRIRRLVGFHAILSFRRHCWAGWLLIGGFRVKVMADFCWPTHSTASRATRLLRLR